ncbi:MAG: hypothetical protein WD766_03400 [Gemmatimonadota bacterium]
MTITISTKPAPFHAGVPLFGAVLAALLLLAIAPARTAEAQRSGGPGWNAWLGCWESVEVVGPGQFQPGDRSTVCVLPTTADDAVELATIAEGTVVSRERLVADGTQRPTERDGCAGWESLAWSGDGARLHQRSHFDCPGNLQRTASGILGFSTDGQWLTVQAVDVGEFTDVRVIRYRAATAPPSIAAEVAESLQNRTMALDAARSAASAPVGVDDVTEATTVVDVAAVEAWLVENGQAFDVDGAGLLRLADAGVPTRVIDLMVALSYPDVFAIDRAAREGEMREDDRPLPPRRAGPVAVLDPWYSPYGYRGYNGRYDRYGRYGRWYGPPVIVVREPPRDEDDAGRLVNGRGYTRGSGGGASSRGTGAASGPRPSAGGSGSDDSGRSTGRTAKPRPD